MEHLITPNELKSLGRPIGRVEDTKLLAYITETEQLNIKPVLGDKLFLDLLEYGEEKEEYKTLLNGGSYSDNNDNVSSFLGLKVAMSYFVYAQNVMSGDFQSTRYGMVLKDGDFSSHISSKERSDCYNNALEVANHYLKECVRYCRHTGLIQNSKKNTIATGGLIIRKIG